MTDSPQGPAEALFASFLERHHESGVGIDALCAEHTEHAPEFRRWWQRLVEAGEVGVAEGGDDPTCARAGDRLGRYRIERELGRGAQGTVYLAVDDDLDRRVALKVIPANFGAIGPRFAREARLASRLDHPHLCTLFDSGVLGDVAFLAMRYVEGRTLADVLAERREPDSTEIAARTRSAESRDERSALADLTRLFEKIARALHAAHCARLVHRDIKPGNLLVSESGDPVVLDFGLARDFETDLALTRTGDAVGTPAYMSPEQIAGRVELDARTDVYSLGATLYECVTGVRPFDGPTRNELYRRIQAGGYVPARRINPFVGKDLEVILATALATDRADRYRTAEDLAEDLRRLGAGSPIRARPIGPAGRLWRWARVHKVIAASVAVVLIALGTGLAVSLAFWAETRRAQGESARLLARLTDDVTLDRAEAAVRAVFPVRPEKLGAITAWLEGFGEPLERALPDHRRKLAALRSRARPDDTARRAAVRVHPLQAEIERLSQEAALVRDYDPKATRTELQAGLLRFADDCDRRIAELERELAEFQRWTYDDPAEQLLHDALARLVDRLERFCAEGSLLDRMRGHRAWAEGAVRRAGSADAQWGEAIEYARASQQYPGVELSPQAGLVPLGVDPRSLLLEFAEERSGTIPNRDPDTGELRVDASSALVFVLVPGGRYRLGRRRDVGGAHERFQRTVELDPYFVSKYEMSRGQWRQLARRDPRSASAVFAMFDPSPGQPLQFVSWHEATTVLDEFGLALPTEAQWEYAASAGRRTRWWWGDGPPVDGAAPGNFRDSAFEGPAGRRTGRVHDDGHFLSAPVHEPFDPNPFGLVGVYGNVAEWCREAFAPRTPLTRFTCDPGDGYHHVIRVGLRSVRGGTFDSPPSRTYTAARNGVREWVGHLGVGVRPVRRLEKP